MASVDKKKRARLLWLALGGLAVAAALALALTPESVPADFAPVGQGLLRVTLDEEGETRVRDRYLVSSPVAGRVLRIELEPGDPVVAGQTVLATFEPADPTLLDPRSEAQARARVRSAEAALGGARAERERAKAELAQAETELARMLRLRADQVVPEERFEQAQLAARRAQEVLHAAEFAVTTAGHELEMARAGLLQASGQGRGAMQLTSPIDGVVLRRLRESEAVVPVGEALVEVADPANLEIVSDYLSKDAVRIVPGATVLIEQWGGEKPLAGRVKRVEPAGFTKISALGVEEQRVNVVVDVEDPRAAWQALGDGYRVEVRVVIYERADAVKVPASSLFRHGDGWAVFRVDGDVARLVPVEVGQRNGQEAEILAGLSPKEHVVLHPSDAVTDGVKVAPRKL